MPNVSAEPKEGILKSRTPSASRIAGADSLEVEQTNRVVVLNGGVRLHG